MRDVALAIKPRLQESLQVARPGFVVKQYVKPTDPYPYVWLPERVVTTPGPFGQHSGVFNVYYRAKGKQACEDLARAGDFIDGHRVVQFGDAHALRYALESRIGPDDDPDEEGVQSIVDTYSCTFVNARSPSVTG